MGAMEEEPSYLQDLLERAGASEFTARTVEFLLDKPIRLALVLLIAALLIRWAAKATRRAVAALHLRGPFGDPHRMEARSKTLGDAAAGAIRVVGWTLAALVVFDELGVNLGPLIAGAGVAGIAIGFGAQSIVRDVLAGVFILAEDRYGVGDVVDLGEATGTIEDVNLRVTRLRSVDGTVWFVNNGEIRRVGNQSMEWSRALLDITVAHDQDVTAVRALIEQAAQEVCASEQWAPVVLEEPEVWGAEALTASGLTMRLVVKTLPKEQYALGRALRERISTTLHGSGVRGPGQNVVVTSQPGAAEDASSGGADI